MMIIMDSMDSVDSCLGLGSRSNLLEALTFERPVNQYGHVIDLGNGTVKSVSNPGFMEVETEFS